MKEVTKEQVVLFLGLMFILVAGVCCLAILGKDPTIILTLAGILAVPILGALGVAVYQKLDQVKEVANGNLTRAHDTLDKYAEKTTAVFQANAEQTAAALQANTEMLSKLVASLAQPVVLPVSPAPPQPPEKGF